MTRFQKLVAATLAMTLALVVVGVIVRATGSGLGCPDWPFCYGQVIPPLEFKAWAEWIHRLIAAVIGVMVLGIAVLAIVDHRDRRSLVLASLGAVALVGFQAWLGRETVRLGNSGASVTAHLAAAMAVAGLLVFLLVRASYPARLRGRGGSQRLTLLVAFAAISTFILLIFGANVTAADAALVFPDWPLMGGALVPPFGDMPPATANLAFTHALHRYVGVVVGIIMAATWVAARRGRRAGTVGPTLYAVITIAAVLYPLQALVGALQEWHVARSRTQTLHVAPRRSSGQRRSGRRSCGDPPRPLGRTGDRRVDRGGRRRQLAPRRGGRRRIGCRAAGLLAAPMPAQIGDGRRHRRRADRGAYDLRRRLRLTEAPDHRVLPADHDRAGDGPGDARPARRELGRLVGSGSSVWMLVGGTLAAGSANAINQYLDRDIDILMVWDSALPTAPPTRWSPSRRSSSGSSSG